MFHLRDTRCAPVNMYDGVGAIAIDIAHNAIRHVRGTRRARVSTSNGGDVITLHIAHNAICHVRGRRRARIETNDGGDVFAFNFADIATGRVRRTRFARVATFDVDVSVCNTAGNVSCHVGEDIARRFGNSLINCVDGGYKAVCRGDMLCGLDASWGQRKRKERRRATTVTRSTTCCRGRERTVDSWKTKVVGGKVGEHRVGIGLQWRWLRRRDNEWKRKQVVDG